MANEAFLSIYMLNWCPPGYIGGRCWAPFWCYYNRNISGNICCCYIREQHRGVVARTMAAQEESIPRHQTFLCWVRMFSPCLCGFALGAPVSPTIKSMQVRLMKSAGMAQSDPPMWPPESHCASSYSIIGKIMTHGMNLWDENECLSVRKFGFPAVFCSLLWPDGGWWQLCLFGSGLRSEGLAVRAPGQNMEGGHVGPCGELAAHSGVDPAFAHCAPSLWPLKAIKWWR